MEAILRLNGKTSSSLDKCQCALLFKPQPQYFVEHPFALITSNKRYWYDCQVSGTTLVESLPILLIQMLPVH